MKKANLPVRAERRENGRKGSVEEKERRRGQGGSLRTKEGN